jgi:hypothetical protein
MIANSFMNYVYFQSYTNQNAAGINVSNFNVFVTNNVSMLPVWDVWGFLWPYATNASFSSLPWTVDGYHPSDYQWKLLATNLVNNIATNALIAAQLDAPQPPKVFHGFAKNTGFFSASTTNYQIAYYANSGVVGASGAKTNNPVTCNMTVSNLLPCTSYSWIMRFRCNGAAGGQRLDLTTDGNTPVLQWDSMYYIGSIQWANEGNYGNTSNSVIAGSARPLSNGSSDVVLQTSQGTFTTSTNFTALQLLISCKSTNTSSVFGEGSLDVWMTGEKIQSF